MIWLCDRCNWIAPVDCTCMRWHRTNEARQPAAKPAPKPATRPERETTRG